MKFYCQYFGLKFAGMLKTPKCTFLARLVGVVGAGWQKSGFNLKTAPKSDVFSP